MLDRQIKSENLRDGPKPSIIITLKDDFYKNLKKTGAEG
jgi:hypothetical protein